jgi:catalase
MPAATELMASSRPTNPCRTYTRADLFQRAGEKTPVFVRFSTVAGNKGSADLARDVRGFAVKMYTKEGNWDLVGNNIPVFFIQDAIKFPDMVHAAKQEPDRAFPQAQTAHDNFWDFISLTPESMHMVMWIMSDRTIPRSFRFMEGFGVHTFRFVNAADESTFVKFHWKPKLGLQSVAWNEAVKINGADPTSIVAISGSRYSRAIFRNGNLRSSSSTRTSPTVSTSTFSTRRRSSPKRSFRYSRSAD